MSFTEFGAGTIFAVLPIALCVRAEHRDPSIETRADQSAVKHDLIGLVSNADALLRVLLQLLQQFLAEFALKLGPNFSTDVACNCVEFIIA